MLCNLYNDMRVCFLLGCTNLHQHCPAGFHSLDSSCYMIGPQRMSWQDAKVKNQYYAFVFPYRFRM